MWTCSSHEQSLLGKDRESGPKRRKSSLTWRCTKFKSIPITLILMTNKNRHIVIFCHNLWTEGKRLSTIIIEFSKTEKKTINRACWEHHLWLHLMIVMQNNQLVAICKERERMVNANWRLAANEIKTGDLLERRLKLVWLLVVTVCNGDFYLLHILLTIGLTTLEKGKLFDIFIVIYLFVYLFILFFRP